MENTVIERVETIINEYLEKNRAAIEDASAQLEKAQASKEKATKESTEAFKRANITEYQKAQEKERKAADTITMLENMIESLRKDSIIGDTDYENYVTDIMAELTRIVSTDKAKMIALMDQIADIGADNNESIRHGNEVLNKLQFKVYRDTAKLPHQHKQFRDRDAYIASQEVIESTGYKKIGGQRISDGKKAMLETIHKYGG